MAVNQDQIILEEVALEDIVEEAEEDATLEMIEEAEEDTTIETVTEIVTAAAVDGNCKT